MILWDYLTALSRYVSADALKSNNCKSNKKYARYLRANELNCNYTSHFNRRHMDILKQIKKIKTFTKNYWYIVIPLHVAMSIGYMSFFYLTSRKTITALKWFNINEEEVEHTRFKYFPNIPKKTLEDIAITMILMKVSAPLRYTTTVLGSKYLLRFLRSRHLVKCLMLHEINPTICREVEVEHVSVIKE